MSNNPKKPGGWKPSGPEKKAPVAAHGWQKEKPGGPQLKGMSRKVKLLLSLCGFFALLALLIIIIGWIGWGKPTAVVLVTSGYETNLALPHNAPGRTGMEELKKGLASLDKIVNIAHSVDNFQNKVEWRPADFKDLKSEVVVLVFSLHGISDNGKNYLLRDVENPAEISQHLSLDDVLTELDGLPEKKKKVLILDVVHSTSQWPLGLIHNDFVSNLKNQYKARIKSIKNLVVLCSTDGHQRAWYSPEWGRSVYLHFLVDGMKGAANEANSGVGVTAWDLHNYTAKNTKRWAFDNREDLQTPILLPDDADGEALAKNITVVAGVDLKPPAVLKDYTDFKSGELKAAWQQWQGLRQRQPAPWVYAPHLWKLYSQAVLRYEELLLVGSRAAPDVKTKADNLAAELTRLRALRLESTAFSLPLSAAAGEFTSRELRNQVQKELMPQLRRNLSTKDWEGILERFNGIDRHLAIQELQRRFLQVDRARDLRVGPLPDILQRLELKKDQERPMEVHFARMMSVDGQFDEVDYDRQDILLRKALQTRLQAEEIALAFDPSDERAYPYAEHIFPWIEKRMAVADEARRHAEDWLFAQKWENATTDYDRKVLPLYEEIRRDVRTLRAALSLRDRGLAELPGLSLSLAQLDTDTTQRITAVEQLWGNLHELDRMLNDAPSDTPGNLQEQIKSIDRLANLVRTELDKAQNEYRKRVRELVEETSQPSFLHELLALSAAAELETPESRAKMLDKFREISKFLLQKTQDSKLDSAKQSDNFATRVQARVARQGRLLLACVGKYNMTDIATYQSIALPKPDVFIIAAQASPRIRAACQGRVAKTIDQRLTEARSVNLTTARAKLREAEQLARHLTVAFAETFKERPFNPSALGREMRMYDLLVWMARRTRLDFWNWERKRPTPYYADAGRRFLEDAEKRLLELRPSTPQLKAEHQEELTAEREQLKSTPRLTLEHELGNPAKLFITSELEYELDFRLKVPQTVPRGFPYTTFRIQNPEYLSQNIQEKRRVAKVDQPNIDSVPLELRLSNLLLKNKSAHAIMAQTQNPRIPTKVDLHTWFRGHVEEQPIDVVLYPFANNVYADTPPAPGAGIALFGKGLERFAPNNSALVIVLDCSGSMADEKTKNAEGETRFDRVKRALSRMLPRISEDTKFSLWIYGQQTPKSTKTSQFASENGGEATIHRLFKTERWKKSMAQDVDKLVEGIKAYSFTPIARAILEASEDLGGRSGFKNLLVLTDGEDTCFEPNNQFKRQGGDPVYNPDGKLTIAKFLAEKFRNSPIQIDLVCFELGQQKSPLNPNETLVDIARRQFGALEGTIKFRLKFVENEQDLLRELLERSKQQLTYFIKEGEAEKAKGIVETRRPDPTPLPAGTYTVVVKGTTVLEEKVQLTAGDYVTLQVVDDGGRLKMVPAPLTEPFKARQEPLRRNGGERTGQTDWILTEVVNLRMPRLPGQKVLVTLESGTEVAARSGDDALMVSRPGFVWMEMRSLQDESKAPLRLYWGRANQAYPVPTWSLEATWNSDAEVDGGARLFIWASGNKPTKEQGYLEKTTHWRLGHMGDPQRGTESDFPRKPPGWSNDSGAKIESVRLETHRIQIGGEERIVDCLVVRAEYEKDAPIFIEVHGSTPRASLHHYYTEARKYTGYFIMPKSEIENVDKLRLYKVETFKKENLTSRGIRKLDKPLPDAPLPEDLQPLKSNTPEGER
jgi:hypothetical protein